MKIIFVLVLIVGAVSSICKLQPLSVALVAAGVDK